MRRHVRDGEFAAFFAARGAALRRTAYGLCGDWSAAEELVQAAFVQLYAAWGRVRSETAEGYARRVVVHLFLNGRRRWVREIAMSPLPDQVVPSVPTDDRVDLAAALAKLPPRQRAIVVLRFLDDLSVAEVARLLDVAEGTVKSQTSRALATLRSSLQPTPNSGGADHG